MGWRSGVSCLPGVNMEAGISRALPCGHGRLLQGRAAPVMARVCGHGRLRCAQAVAVGRAAPVMASCCGHVRQGLVQQESRPPRLPAELQ